ncbi:MAG: iron-containing alcohol dehydrogenase [Oscillospiraceae bacterium]|nr:iron-containing alcohol dehydrogenase [Oscillospiraceae bacterium]
MDIRKLVAGLKNCPCGREHSVDIKAVEIGSGLKSRAAEILKENGFPSRALVVADRNTLNAADGILGVLTSGGFDCTLKLYDDLRTAHMRDVDDITALCRDVRGVLSVGSGSLNDICRLAAFRADKAFAIFATAPSMDGFASDTAPITDNNFKFSYPARQPSVIIGDTKILAAAPAELKSAGFGDMIAKCIGLADWKLSHLITGEYYCENVAAITQTAFDRVVSLAGRVTDNDEETAGAIMEALVLTGLAMKLGYSVRPASGAEHVVSHFWEIKKLEQGLTSDFHGKKVGVATLMVNRLYKQICENADPAKFAPERLDWEKIYAAYGESFIADVKRMNNPTVTQETSVERIRENWGEICRIMLEELPSDGKLTALMKKAGAATTLEEISVPRELGLLGLEYHPYMRNRILLSRLVPMLNVDVIYSDLIRNC